MLLQLVIFNCMPEYGEKLHRGELLVLAHCSQINARGLPFPTLVAAEVMTLFKLSIARLAWRSDWQYRPRKMLQSGYIFSVFLSLLMFLPL